MGKTHLASGSLTCHYLPPAGHAQLAELQQRNRTNRTRKVFSEQLFDRQWDTSTNTAHLNPLVTPELLRHHTTRVAIHWEVVQLRSKTNLRQICVPQSFTKSSNGVKDENNLPAVKWRLEVHQYYQSSRNSPFVLQSLRPQIWPASCNAIQIEDLRQYTCNAYTRNIPLTWWFHP